MQKRANDLAAVQVKPISVPVAFGDFRKGLAMQPALPGEDFQLENEQ